MILVLAGHLRTRHLTPLPLHRVPLPPRTRLQSVHGSDTQGDARSCAVHQLPAGGALTLFGVALLLNAFDIKILHVMLWTLGGLQLYLHLVALDGHFEIPVFLLGRQIRIPNLRAPLPHTHKLLKK